MTKPVIGVTSSSTFGKRYFDPYMDAVRLAGGIPQSLDTKCSPIEAIARIDGLIVCGGPDISPALYYEDKHHMTMPLDPERDELEWALLRFARKLEVPTLGICRGFQLLNVLYGGSLQQHIDHDLHRPSNWNQLVMHDVHLMPHSVLAKLYQATTIRVNSRHHQGVRANMVGKGLNAIAFSLDGFVEAVMSTNCINWGIQWHPEDLFATGTTNEVFFYLTELANEVRATLN